MATVVAANVALSATSMAQTETTIWSFPKGAFPRSALTLDPANSVIYGATFGGIYGYGTAFKLHMNHGVWKHGVLYRFSGGSDGANPSGGLSEDATGALYGTTQNGGDSQYGTAFKLTFNGSSWTYTLIHSFGGGSDGAWPNADLTIDQATGAIYGTTSGGGAANCGTVFELSPSGGETVLYAFKNGSDGCNAFSPVREDAKGRLYGVTSFGGSSRNSGTVYRLEQSHGVWTESVIHRFVRHDDGVVPTDLDMDPATDTIYGTTSGGGSGGKGLVYELTPARKGWQETVLYRFAPAPDGAFPQGLHLDASTGVLYGTTTYGGQYGSGTLFQLTGTGSSWTETQLHSFSNKGGDGFYPWARPTEDPKTGYLFGTTTEGGAHNGGTAYMVVP